MNLYEFVSSNGFCYSVISFGKSFGELSQQKKHLQTTDRPNISMTRAPSYYSEILLILNPIKHQDV